MFKLQPSDAACGATVTLTDLSQEVSETLIGRIRRDWVEQHVLAESWRWQTREAFQYTHEWQENMLVIRDNGSILHKANGGYDGYARELHRTTTSTAPTRYLAA